MAKRKFTTTLDETLLKQIKIAAVEQDTSVADLLEHMADEYLTEKEHA
ncbi:hypothetical protein ABTQ33_03070 [Paucilactobacillus suebicus]|nr:hypothetical protein [Paucilactobacillus suebicus]